MRPYLFAMRLNFVWEETFCIESQFPAGDALVVRARDAYSI